MRFRWQREPLVHLQHLIIRFCSPRPTEVAKCDRNAGPPASLSPPNICSWPQQPGQPSRLHPGPGAVTSARAPARGPKTGCRRHPLACRPSRFTPAARPGMTHRDEQSMRRDGPKAPMPIRCFKQWAAKNPKFGDMCAPQSGVEAEHIIPPQWSPGSSIAPKCWVGVVIGARQSAPLSTVSRTKSGPP